MLLPPNAALVAGATGAPEGCDSLALSLQKLQLVCGTQNGQIGM